MAQQYRYDKFLKENEKPVSKVITPVSPLTTGLRLGLGLGLGLSLREYPCYVYPGSRESPRQGRKGIDVRVRGQGQGQGQGIEGNSKFSLSLALETRDVLRLAS
jgi:hypothetical protein